MKGLPIGIQSLVHIRENNYVYVDKTAWAYKMISAPAYFFLSRPRRFGKSLYLDTLKQIFLGKKHLFEDCFIYDKIDWQPRPVIHLQFDKMTTTKDFFEPSFLYRLQQNAANNAVKITKNTIKEATEELISGLHQKYGKTVAILIDEYDEPLLRHFNTPTALVNRSLMAEFYKALKACNESIFMVMITGVSKFAQLSLFSGANNLLDISLNPEFGAICGYTQAELDTNFEVYLRKAAENYPEYTETEFYAELKRFYNGYSWRGEKVYNPFSILRFLHLKEFGNYWIATGSPKFLIEAMKNQFVYDAEKTNISEVLLNTGFDVETTHPTALMFQTGYLTIVQHNRRLRAYDLDYPNAEVREAFNWFLLQAFTFQPYMTNNPAIIMYDSLLQNNIPKFIEYTNNLFAQIPEPIFIRAYEAYYHSIIFISFLLLNIEARSEEPTNKGRIDMMIRTPQRLFLVEFKINDSAQTALNQIQEKKYYEKYLHERLPITLVGIALGATQRGIVDWKTTEI